MELAAQKNNDEIVDLLLSQGQKSIECRAFSHCFRLAKIVIPSSITKIDQYAFNGCLSLVEISIPSSVTIIGKGAFKRCAFTKILIHSTVTSICEEAFTSCNYLKEIIFEKPCSLKSIEPKTFEGCMSLTQLTIPKSVISIGKFSFWQLQKINRS